MLDHSCIRYQDLSQNRALFISDIHGEGELLKELLRKVHYVPGQDSLFLLGDLTAAGRNHSAADEAGISADAAVADQ